MYWSLFQVSKPALQGQSLKIVGAVVGIAQSPSQ